MDRFYALDREARGQPGLVWVFTPVFAAVAEADRRSQTQLQCAVRGGGGGGTLPAG